MTPTWAEWARSKATSDRAIVGLTAFDDRLARLERSVDGIHGSTVGLTRVNKSAQHCDRCASLPNTMQTSPLSSPPSTGSSPITT
jgi:hypothetical protein